MTAPFRSNTLRYLMLILAIFTGLFWFFSTPLKMDLREFQIHKSPQIFLEFFTFPFIQSLASFCMKNPQLGIGIFIFSWIFGKIMDLVKGRWSHRPPGWLGVAMDPPRHGGLMEKCVTIVSKTPLFTVIAETPSWILDLVWFTFKMLMFQFLVGLLIFTWIKDPKFWMDIPLQSVFSCFSMLFTKAMEGVMVFVFSKSSCVHNPPPVRRGFCARTLFSNGQTLRVQTFQICWVFIPKGRHRPVGKCVPQQPGLTEDAVLIPLTVWPFPSFYQDFGWQWKKCQKVPFSSLVSPCNSYVIGHKLWPKFLTNLFLSQCGEK